MRKRLARILRSTVAIFVRIDGAQAAAAFTYYAFFSLFPLILLLVTVATLFINRDQAGAAVLGYLKAYIPITGQLQLSLFSTLAAVIEARGQASVFATLLLVWGALQLFTTLITATNRAWSTPAYSWWRLLLKSLLFLTGMVGAVLLGVAVPALTRVETVVLPILVVFLSLNLFYRSAPNHPTPPPPVWQAALTATLLLALLNRFFMFYLEYFVRLNLIYGAIGTVMALLLWIYFSSTILIFGSCLCAAQAEETSRAGES